MKDLENQLNKMTSDYKQLKSDFDRLQNNQSPKVFHFCFCNHLTILSILEN